jgi:hypothetical protein
VTIGLDIGLKWDCSALAAVARVDPDGPLVLHTPTVLEPPRDGSAMAVEDIVAAAELLAATHLRRGP